MQKLKQNTEQNERTSKKKKMRQRVSAMHLTKELCAALYIILFIHKFIATQSWRVIFDV